MICKTPFSKATLIALGAFGLSACATIPPPGPVEVTRFHQADPLAQVRDGTFFVETAPDLEDSGIEVGLYKAAIAQQLTALGMREGARSDADVIAQVSLERFEIDRLGRQRGPVSVGVGGSTGSYGSGVGLGVGINLGGASNKPRVGTELAVALRSATDGEVTSTNLWEGRASLEATLGTPEAAAAFNAPVLSSALFRDFPGGNGETVVIDVDEFQEPQ